MLVGGPGYSLSLGRRRAVISECPAGSCVDRLEEPVGLKWDLSLGSPKGSEISVPAFPRGGGQVWGAGRCSESWSEVAPLCLLSSLSLLTALQMLPQHRALPLDSSPNQFSLYTSPSLPNISLGLQATVTVTNSHLTVSMGHGLLGPRCP